MSYTVTLKVELVGIPHTWITLTDANGNSVSYGYAGDNSNGDYPWPINLGKVYKDDGTTQEKAGDENVILEGNGWVERYEITPEQYQSMVNRAEQIKGDPGTYLGVGNNCVDFVRDILSTGNVPHPLGIGPHPASLIPIRQRHETLGNVENMVWLDNFLDGGLSIEEFEDLFTTAASTYISPIILDLDGDGVETIGVNAGAYFDHDGNGFAEQTGWVGADDGLLVWDRDGDGRINNGKELFGNETLLANGAKAANGYAALSELDTSADGKVDVNDAAFASLKVWKDLDGDGYSSNGELFSLTDVGVQSINTGATNSTYVDPNSNAHTLTGSFTKTDGSTR